MSEVILLGKLVFFLVAFPSTIICDCPNELPVGKSNLDLEQLDGMWYEFGANTRDFPYLFADTGCVPLCFHEVDNPRVEYIYYRNMTEESSLRTIALFYPNNEVFKIVYMRAKKYLRGTLLVLDTDYKCWAVLYTCVNSEPVYVSVLQRSVGGKKCLAERKLENEVEPVLNKVNLKLSDMMLNIEGEGCEYTPDPIELT